jgi:multicomponent Na+:H+ antiporter subunit D
MAGAAILCVLIGVFPALLYGILPLPVEYNAWEPVRFGETVLILGAAALFFFTVGKRVLAPHETRLRDADLVYQGMGRTIVAFAGGLQEGFGAIYGIAIGAAHAMYAIGARIMVLERPDVNRGLCGFAALLVLAIAILLGVGL